MANTPIQDILVLADELSSLSIKLACDLYPGSSFFSPQEAAATLEQILETSNKLTSPEQFAHIKSFLNECEHDTAEFEATKKLSEEQLGL